jgi:hypothetical protein
MSFVFFFLQRPKKTQEATPEYQEDKVFQLYTKIEDMLDSFEEYVREMHVGLEEKRQELIELNRQAQVVYMQAMTAAQSQIPVGGMGGQPPAMPVGAPDHIVPRATEPVAPTISPKPEKNGKSTPSRLTDKDKESLGRLATKPQKVRYLMSRGFSLDEVAKELDIGRGEVILIADLDKG